MGRKHKGTAAQGTDAQVLQAGSSGEALLRRWRPVPRPSLGHAAWLASCRDLSPEPWLASCAGLVRRCAADADVIRIMHQKHHKTFQDRSLFYPPMQRITQKVLSSGMTFAK